VVLLSIAGFHLIGGYGWLDAIWMVAVTISTVGFSERSTEGAAVQILTMGVILFGVSSAAYTCGGFIQLALEGEVDRVLGRRKMTKEISRLRDHVIVCGFGRMGQDLANQLRHRGIGHVVIDQDSEKTLLADELNTLAVVGDATSEPILLAANLDHARALVTALPTDAENVFIALTARNLRPDIQIIAKSEQESSCRKLRQAGANKIVMPHRVGAQQMERMISRPSTADLFELFAEASHLDMDLDEFLVGEKNVLVGQTVGESRLKEDFNLLVVAIKDREGNFSFNPSRDKLISESDTLLVIGELGAINRLKASCLPR
jgi:voltage-gated potassium channel